MYRFTLLAALLPVLALADEPAPDWKAEIELGKKAIAAHDYRTASERFSAALKLAESSPAEVTGRLESNNVFFFFFCLLRYGSGLAGS